ncbi:DMT family transporter [Pseudogemmobacter sonorensis]|uniref:DMT family transporter n=1 Tax=Pseudogemmobacter sonorensis TaxID=2989681 RepID=UPI0036BEC1F4
MRPLRGICYKLTAVLIFTAMSAMIKATADHVPGWQAVFFRSFFAIPVIILWMAYRRELAGGFRTANPMGHVWRGLAGTVAMGLMFSGLAFLPFPEVTAIGYATPLLTVAFAAFLLGEKVRAFRAMTVLLGLVGVLIVLWPRLSVLRGGEAGQAEAFGAMLVLGGSVCSALAYVFVRKLTATEKTPAIVFYFSLTATVLSLFTIPLGWVRPTPVEFALLVGAGLVGGVAQIFLTSSYREADASVVAPFDYASMLFALAIGWFVFAEAPTWTMLGGASIVILAGLLIIWRERQLGIRRERQRKASTPQG